MKKIAVITGASSGIGREFALQIAQKYKTVEDMAYSQKEGQAHRG